MKNFRRFFCLILCLAMLTPALAPDNVVAAEAGSTGTLNKANYYCTAPVVGEMPSIAMSSDVDDLVYFNHVQWRGDFAEDGSFLAGEKYLFYFRAHIRDGVDLVFPKKVTEETCHAVNGNPLANYYTSNGGKTLLVTYSFQLEEDSKKVDSWHYTKEEADACWWDSMPNLFVADSVDDTIWLNRVLNRDEQNQITRIIVDCENPDPLFLQTIQNATEVWLSPKVDAIKFLSDLTNVSINPEMQYSPYAMETNGAKTWDFKLYVSDQSVANGLASLYEKGDDRLVWFETLLYSGDVYEAYNKLHSGQNVVRAWCTNHVYTREVRTADRVMIEKDCQHTRWFCYSCKYCGKPENNPNHVFSRTQEITPNYLNDYTGSTAHDWTYCKEITAANFIGVNSRGEYVYMKSCVTCGLNAAGMVSESDLSREKFNQTLGISYDGTYEEYIAESRKYWTNVVMPNNLKNAKAGVNNSAVYAFAVDCAPVSATVSAWAENEVNWAKVNGLLDEALLGNNYKKEISRLQFCSIAVRLAETLLGEEITPAPANSFTDTSNTYVLKAVAAGITNGVGNNKFDPNATLTRQQMATFIHRALMYVRDNSGIRYTIYDSKLGSYTDSGKIAAWAKESMAFMNALDLVKGTSSTTLAPTANCTIEQAILVAQRSLSADQIGWYQCIQSTDRTTMGAQGDEFDRQYRFGYSGHTQTTFQCGDRLWITGARLGGEKGYGLLPTTNPYTGDTCWVVAEGLKPIKDMG